MDLNVEFMVNNKFQLVLFVVSVVVKLVFIKKADTSEPFHLKENKKFSFKPKICCQIVSCSLETNFCVCFINERFIVFHYSEL